MGRNRSLSNQGQESRGLVLERVHISEGSSRLLLFTGRQHHVIVAVIVVVPVGGSIHAVLDAKLSIDGSGEMCEGDGELKLVKVHRSKRLHVGRVGEDQVALPVVKGKFHGEGFFKRQVLAHHQEHKQGLIGSKGHQLEIDGRVLSVVNVFGGREVRRGDLVRSILGVFAEGVGAFRVRVGLVKPQVGEVAVGRKVVVEVKVVQQR